MKPDVSLFAVTKYALPILPLFVLCLTCPASAFSQKLLDSLPIWKEQQAFSKICDAADQIIQGKERKLSKCDKVTCFTAASSAALDLFKPTLALGYAQAALSTKCKDSLLIMRAKMGAATAYNLLMQLDSAILLTQEVIEFAELKKEMDLLISANVNLGMMLNKNGAYREAKASFLRANALTDRTNSRRMAISLLNIALCNLNLKEYEEALIKVDSGLYYAKKSQILPIIAHTLGLKSDILHAQKNYALWEPTLDSAISVSLQAGNTVQATYGIIAKFDHYISTKNFPKALYFGNKALSILENGDQFPLLQKNYKGLYTVYKAVGNDAQALLFLEKYLSLKDSLDNSRYNQKIQELNLKFEVAEKESKILQQEVQIRKDRIWLISLVFGLFVLSSLVFFVAWKNALHKKNIQIFFKKERELETEVARLTKILPLSPTNKAVTDDSDQDSSEFYIQRIHSLMEREKWYLNPDFSREDLAQLLGTNRSYLSQAINNIEGGGFRMLINKYRVSEAKSLIWEIAKKKSEIPLTNIWELTGFNSNQSFYRVFKSLTNLTPKEYLEQVNQEIVDKSLSAKEDGKEIF